MKPNRQQLRYIRYKYVQFICNQHKLNAHPELAYLWKAENYTIWKGK